MMSTDAVLADFGASLGKLVTLEGEARGIYGHVYFVPTQAPSGFDSQTAGVIIVLPGISREMSYIGALVRRGGYSCPSQFVYVKATGVIALSPVEPFAGALTHITELIVKTHEGLQSVDVETIGDPREIEIQVIMRDPILTPEEKQESIAERRAQRLKW